MAIEKNIYSFKRGDKVTSLNGISGVIEYIPQSIGGVAIAYVRVDNSNNMFVFPLRELRKQENNADCDTCLYQKLCFRQYGTMYKEWARECGCNRYEDKTRYFKKPCEIGDKVYCVFANSIDEGTVTEIRLKKNNITDIVVKYKGFSLAHCAETAINKDLFFDKAAAERALKESEAATNAKL